MCISEIVNNSFDKCFIQTGFPRFNYSNLALFFLYALHEKKTSS